jgi:FlaA1/EpsC-like NDP-sugar epimerase
VSGIPSSSGLVAVGRPAGVIRGRSGSWMQTYVLYTAAADFSAAAVAGIAAAGVRFRSHPNDDYLILSMALPLLWMIALRIAGGYERQFIGSGADEFRKVLNAGLSVTAALIFASYSVNNELSRIYLIVSMQVIVALDLMARYALRKRLHRRRARGQCMSTVIAVGHEAAVQQLISELRRET